MTNVNTLTNEWDLRLYYSLLLCAVEGGRSLGGSGPSERMMGFMDLGHFSLWLAARLRRWLRLLPTSLLQDRISSNSKLIHKFSAEGERLWHRKKERSSLSFVSRLCCVGRREDAECCCCCCSRSSALYASMALSEVQNQTSCEKWKKGERRGEKRKIENEYFIQNNRVSATAATAVKTQQRRCSRDTPAADDDNEKIYKKEKKERKVSLFNVNFLFTSEQRWLSTEQLY